MILAVAEKPLSGHFPSFPWSWWSVWLRGMAWHLLWCGVLEVGSGSVTQLGGTKEWPQDVWWLVSQIATVGRG